MLYYLINIFDNHRWLNYSPFSFESKPTWISLFVYESYRRLLYLDDYDLDSYDLLR